MKADDEMKYKYNGSMIERIDEDEGLGDMLGGTVTLQTYKGQPSSIVIYANYFDAAEEHIGEIDGPYLEVVPEEIDKICDALQSFKKLFPNIDQD